MIELERLYDCVEKSLLTSPPDWPRFAAGFAAIFKANMVLYRARFGSDGNLMGGLDVIATSHPDLMREYLDQKIYELHPIPETSLAPLEPLRRTDTMDDETFRNLGTLSDFLISNGMFYLMIVPAIMPDGSFVSLYVWRSAGEDDYTNLEKQRLTLLMRHLLAIVGSKQLTPDEPDGDIVTFGSAYNLTPAEVDVLAALLQGRSLRAIAQESARTYGTVRWHVQNILEKCQVNTQKNLLTEFYRLVKR